MTTAETSSVLGASLPEAGLRHLQAWSSTDPGAVAASAATFVGPMEPGAPSAPENSLRGGALRAHATAVFARVRDLRFTARDVLVGQHGAAITWTMDGRCATTGAAVRADGIDQLSATGDGLHVLRRHEPTALPLPGAGQWEHGTSTRRLGGRPGAVGALTLTRLTVDGAAQAEEVDRLSVETVRALWASRGVLGVATFTLGADKYTVATFEDVDAVRAVHSRAHHRSVKKVFRSGLCNSAWTTVWSLARLSAYERCAGCGALARVDPSTRTVVDSGCPCERQAVDGRFL